LVLSLTDERFHTQSIFLEDKNKRIRDVYNGKLSFDMKQLIEDINTLKAENYRLIYLSVTPEKLQYNTDLMFWRNYICANIHK
jgi:hypothetical protein